MKTKLVLWGTNEENARVLIALELLPQENLVRSFIFPEEIASEAFSRAMLEQWRDGHTVEFPVGFTSAERELTLSESILPPNLKPEREDIISRAQTEWHFVVLSSKLHDAYLSELGEIKEKIAKLTRFDTGIWDELKGFWDKVQSQVRDKNLFREHGDFLRDKTNELFGELKSLRNKLDQEFEQTSKENLERFQQLFSEIERKIENGARLQSLFDELKALQEKFRNTRFTKEHRNKVWDTLDALFKSVKERRFGAAPADDRSPSDRLERRYEGLVSAIDKMERSIQRDEEDLDFQKHKAETTGGQLEAQIRQAKVLMIEERIRSKKDKLNEMLATRTDLEKRMDSQRAKDAKKAEKEKLEEARKLAEEKIASEIKAAAVAREADSEKLEKAAGEIAQPAAETAAKEPPRESLLDAITETLGDSLEDVVDTVKAVAEVVGEKMEETLGDLQDKIQEMIQPDAPAPQKPHAPAPDQPESADETPQYRDVAPQAPLEDRPEGADDEKAVV
ncbi:MAG: hypothetical protein ACOYOO_07695 [Saprospiraceae bacterium]